MSSAIEQLVKDSINDGFRMGIVQAADLLLEASQVPGIHPEEARVLIDASRFVMYLHAAPEKIKP